MIDNQLQLLVKYRLQEAVETFFRDRIRLGAIASNRKIARSKTSTQFLSE